MKVIKRSNLPAYLPVLHTAVVILTLSEFNFAEWVWGVVITLLVIVWIAAVYKILKASEVDIFKEIEED